MNKNVGIVLTAQSDKLKKELNNAVQAINAFQREGTKGLEKVGVSTKELNKLQSALKRQFQKAAIGSKDYSKSLQDLNTVQDALGKKTNKTSKGVSDFALTSLPAATVALGAISAAAMGAASAFSAYRDSMYNNFEKSTNRVIALSGESIANLKGVQAQLMQIASTRTQSPVEASKGLEVLAQAGYKTSKALQILPSVLDLSTVANMELSSATSIATKAIGGFGLQATESQRIVDVLALATNKANINVEQLGEGFKDAGAITNMLGGSVEETTALLSIFVGKGQEASSVGAALRTVAIQANTVKGRLGKALEQVGVKMGDFSALVKDRGLIGAFEEIARKLGGWEKLVASVGVEQGVFVELLKNSRGQIRNLTTDLQSAEGAAAKMTATMLHGGSGAISKLDASFDTFLTNLTSKFAPMMEDIATGIKGIVDEANELLQDETLTYVQRVEKRASKGEEISDVDKRIVKSYYNNEADNLKRNLTEANTNYTESFLAHAEAKERLDEFYDRFSSIAALDENRVKQVNLVNKLEQEMLLKLAKKKQILEQIEALRAKGELPYKPNSPTNIATNEKTNSDVFNYDEILDEEAIEDIVHDFPEELSEKLGEGFNQSESMLKVGEQAGNQFNAGFNLSMQNSLKEVSETAAESMDYISIFGDITSQVDSAVNAFSNLNSVMEDPDASGWEKMSTAISTTIGIMQTMMAVSKAAAALGAMLSAQKNAENTSNAVTGAVSSANSTAAATPYGAYILAGLLAMTLGVTFAALAKSGSGSGGGGGGGVSAPSLPRPNMGGAAIKNPTQSANFSAVNRASKSNDVQVSGQLRVKGRDLEAALQSNNRKSNDR